MLTPIHQPHKKPFQLLFAEALSLTDLGEDKSRGWHMAGNNQRGQPLLPKSRSSPKSRRGDGGSFRKGGKGAALLPDAIRPGSYLSRAWLVRLAGMRPGQYTSAGTRCPPSQVVCFAELPPAREKGSAQHPAARELCVDGKTSRPPSFPGKGRTRRQRWSK